MSHPKIAINGFGRIGRICFRVWWTRHQDDFDLVAINTSGSMNLEDWFHLVKYDTSYGIFDEPISFNQHQTKDEVTDEDPLLGEVTIGNKTIKVTAQRDPAKLPWDEYQVDTVIESTGIFKDEKSAGAHLEAGAKKVLISAPTKDAGIESSVIGVNSLTQKSNIASNASCTTNCVAPVVKVMVDAFGVEKALLTTIHSYTDDQNTQDNSHKKDLRRARAAAENIIPTSTGAAKATTQIIPSLEGKFDGLAIRVPTPTGSLIDAVFVTSKDVTVEEVNQAFRDAANSDSLKGILAVTTDPIVSSDIVGRSESSIVDLPLTMVIGGNLVKVISWYDNEWGYACRLMEQAGNL